jgi:FkbM family methyltransferase
MNSSSALRLFRRLLRSLFTGRPATHVEVERAEWTFYIKYLREGMVVFDVGAHIGELTLLFSRFVGQRGQVHAFEASSSVFERSRAVCEAARRKNVILNHTAITDKQGIVELYVYDDDHSGWNTLAKRPLKERGINVEPLGTEQVQSTTVDIYCEQNSIEQIDLLKIDVEGAEYQVLLGARRMLQEKRICCCVFEFGRTCFDMGNDPKHLEEYLRDLGYKTHNIVPGSPVMLSRATIENARFSVYVACPR